MTTPISNRSNRGRALYEEQATPYRISGYKQDLHQTEFVPVMIDTCVLSELECFPEGVKPLLTGPLYDEAFQRCNYKGGIELPNLPPQKASEHYSGFQKRCNLLRDVEPLEPLISPQKIETVLDESYAVVKSKYDSAVKTEPFLVGGVKNRVKIKLLAFSMMYFYRKSIGEPLAQVTECLINTWLNEQIERNIAVSNFFSELNQLDDVDQVVGLVRGSVQLVDEYSVVIKNLFLNLEKEVFVAGQEMVLDDNQRYFADFLEAHTYISPFYVQYRHMSAAGTQQKKDALPLVFRDCLGRELTHPTKLKIKSVQTSLNEQYQQYEEQIKVILASGEKDGQRAINALSQGMYETEEKLVNTELSSLFIQEKSHEIEAQSQLAASEEPITASQKLTRFFHKYLLQKKAVHSLIDVKFDANDMAMCMDAVRRGVPVLTVNDKMKSQVVSNFARMFYFGRDVQIITLNDMKKWAEDKNITIETVQDLTADKLCRYMDERCDMRKLPAVLNSKTFQEMIQLHPIAKKLDYDFGAAKPTVVEESMAAAEPENRTNSEKPTGADPASPTTVSSVGFFSPKGPATQNKPGDRLDESSKPNPKPKRA